MGIPHFSWIAYDIPEGTTAVCNDLEFPDGILIFLNYR
jgi:hypothetical protein